MIKKCIIPASGRGTVWSPVSEFVPKEMLPLLNYPVIHYTFQEAFRSGLNQIAIVITYDKEIIRNYIYKNFGDFIQHGLTLEFIYQEEAMGEGDAILTCEHFVQGEPFCVIIPDDIFFFHSLPLVKLKDIYEHEAKSSAILGLVSVDKDSAGDYPYFNFQKKSHHIYTINKLYSGKEEDIKNTSSYKNSLRIAGRYILDPLVFEYLTELKRVERQITVDHLFMNMLDKGERFLASHIKDPCFNIGNIEGFVKANHTFFYF